MSTPQTVAVILMGVAGSGKSLVGASLAQSHSWEFADGDAFHSPHNLNRMHAGHALADDERGPWLAALQEWLAQHVARGEPVVLACSSLKRRYRDVLRDAGSGVCFVYLAASHELIRARLALRRDHFFPASLVASQFADLEPPTPDEGALVVDAAMSPDSIVAAIDAWLAQCDP